MSKPLLAAAMLFAATAVGTGANAKTIVTGGEVTVEVTYDLVSSYLWGTAASGSPAATINEDGNPEIVLPIQASRGVDYTRGSQAIDGGYALTLNGGVYLFALDAEYNELESFDEEGNRLCCRNTLGNLSLNTVTGEVNGRINGVRRDETLLFTLGEEVSEGTYELIVSDFLGLMLSYAYSEYNAEWFPLYSEWPNTDGIPNLAGQSVGLISYAIESETLPAPVPVPAALPLLVGGLGVMGLVRSKRRKSA